MKTLIDVINECDADCYVVITAGNGCGNPIVVDYDADDERLETEMRQMLTVDLAYPDSEETLKEILCDLCLWDPQGQQVWASDWIVTGEGDNPARYRIIF